LLGQGGLCDANTGLQFADITLALGKLTEQHQPIPIAQGLEQGLSPVCSALQTLQIYSFSRKLHGK
jgi:hypothetical protein